MSRRADPAPPPSRGLRLAAACAAARRLAARLLPSRPSAQRAAPSGRSRPGAAVADPRSPAWTKPGAPLAPMPPLRPPAALNDNPLQAVHDAVERALKARGHLG